MKLKYSALALILAVAGCMTSAFAQVTYNFDNIQYSSGGVTDTFTQFLGINNEGIVAGYHGASINKGFTYNTSTKTFTNENFPGSSQTQVTAINNAGKTAGFYVSGGDFFGFVSQGGSFQSADYPGEPFNQLLSQNDKAQAAGYYSTTASGSAPDHAYIYDEVGAVFEVFTIPNSKGGAQATGINNSGQVCGFVIDGSGNMHGWLQSLGTFTLLNYSGMGTTQTAALGLNNMGQVVGSYTDSTGSHGFVYEISTKKWQPIDDPDGIGTTIVNGINDNGVLVGFFGTTPDNTAFIATPKP
jgi:hypothetical protein